MFRNMSGDVPENVQRNNQEKIKKNSGKKSGKFPEFFRKKIRNNSGKKSGMFLKFSEKIRSGTFPEKFRKIPCWDCLPEMGTASSSSRSRLIDEAEEEKMTIPGVYLEFFQNLFVFLSEHFEKFAEMFWIISGNTFEIFPEHFQFFPGNVPEK